MQLKSVTISNFRRYASAVTTDFGNFTAFIGKNDAGKSTILEALDIFFNDGKGCVKLDQNDVNVANRQLERPNTDISIGVCFEDLPSEITIDDTNKTTLESEYLLNDRGQLEIVKVYHNAGKPKVFIRALHPTNPNCAKLSSMNQNELRHLLNAEGITANQTRNADMRKAIWAHYSNDLDLKMTDIDITSTTLWDKLQRYLPLYTLFQADRRNTDNDSEVQDPLKAAVREILNDEDVSDHLREVAHIVEERLRAVSDRTLAKLQEMNPDTAKALKLVIPDYTNLKWADVFKSVSITGDNDIPINKRGSGVKRLVLLNFFRAEVERRQQNCNAPSTIYAFEEPETAQHTDNLIMLISSLLKLSETPNTQIIITTHNANVVLRLHYDNLRLILNTNEIASIQSVCRCQLTYPSLNEINYIAFSEISEAYHDELYAYLKYYKLFDAYKAGKPTRLYIKVQNNAQDTEQQVILSEYIRHQIHHPENQKNPHYTAEELRKSIEMMREFIATHRANQG